jgi:hypothetical protein
MYCAAMRDDVFPCLFDGNRVGRDLVPFLRLRPANAVGDHALDIRMMVDGVDFVPGAEVEDAAEAACPSRAAAEDFAALEPRHKDQFVRCWNSKGFTVHFGVFDLDAVADACGDGVAWIDHPDALSLACFPPAEGATRAHESLEDFREMPGVKDDESRASEDALLHAGDGFVEDGVVGGVAPPEEDVCFVENGLGQALIWLIECGGADDEIVVVAECFRQQTVDAFGVDLCDGGVLAFVNEFVPDGDADGCGHGLLSICHELIANGLLACQRPHEPPAR